MFWILAVSSMLGYSAQNALMAEPCRRLNSLTLVAARGLSLGISMLPLLLIAEKRDGSSIEYFFPLLLASAVSAAIGNWAEAQALRRLPVGIVMTVQQGLLMVFVATSSVWFLHDELSIEQAGLIAIVLFSSTSLTWSRSSSQSNEEKRSNVIVGVGFCVLFSIALACAFSVVTFMSRKGDPAFIAYMWELSIGIVALCALLPLLRNNVKKYRCTRKDCLSVFMRSSPTLIGTGCYAFAVQMGPLSVMNAMLGGIAAVSAIFGSILYRERLSFGEWLAVAGTVLGIVGFKATA